MRLSVSREKSSTYADSGHIIKEVAMFGSSALRFVVAIALLWPAVARCAEPPKRIEAHESEVTALAFSPDGAILVSAGADGRVLAWDIKAGGASHRCPALEGKVFAVAYAPDGKRFASAGSDGLVRVWDAATGKLAEQHKGHDGPVATLAFSPDGKLLASGGYDRAIRLWPTGGGKARVLKGAEGRVTALAFTPDGGSLLSGGAALTDVRVDAEVYTRIGHADYVRIWDVASGKLAKKLETRGSVLALLPGGRVVAAGLVPVVKVTKDELSLDGTDTITIVDLKTGKRTARLEFRGLMAAAAPDGKTVVCAAGSFNHLAGNICMANNGQGIVRGLQAAAKVDTLTIDPGQRGPNNQIWCNGGGRVDHRMTFRDPATLKERSKYVDESVGALAFSPDGRTLAVGSTDGEIRFLAIDPKER
jgi:WD40 repeat protein